MQVDFVPRGSFFLNARGQTIITKTLCKYTQDVVKQPHDAYVDVRFAYFIDESFDEVNKVLDSRVVCQKCKHEHTISEPHIYDIPDLCSDCTKLPVAPAFCSHIDRFTPPWKRSNVRKEGVDNKTTKAPTQDKLMAERSVQEDTMIRVNHSVVYNRDTDLKIASVDEKYWVDEIAKTPMRDNIKTTELTQEELMSIAMTERSKAVQEHQFFERIADLVIPNGIELIWSDVRAILDDAEFDMKPHLSERDEMRAVLSHIYFNWSGEQTRWSLFKDLIDSEYGLCTFFPQLFEKLVERIKTNNTNMLFRFDVKLDSKNLPDDLNFTSNMKRIFSGETLETIIACMRPCGLRRLETYADWYPEEERCFLQYMAHTALTWDCVDTQVYWKHFVANSNLPKITDAFEAHMKNPPITTFQMHPGVIKELTEMRIEDQKKKLEEEVIAPFKEMIKGDREIVRMLHNIFGFLLQQADKEDEEKLARKLSNAIQDLHDQDNPKQETHNVLRATLSQLSALPLSDNDEVCEDIPDSMIETLEETKQRIAQQSDDITEFYKNVETPKKPLFYTHTISMICKACLADPKKAAKGPCKHLDKPWKKPGASVDFKTPHHKRHERVLPQTLNKTLTEEEVERYQREQDEHDLVCKEQCANQMPGYHAFKVSMLCKKCSTIPLRIALGYCSHKVPTPTPYYWPRNVAEREKDRQIVEGVKASIIADAIQCLEDVKATEDDFVVIGEKAKDSFF